MMTDEIKQISYIGDDNLTVEDSLKLPAVGASLKWDEQLSRETLLSAAKADQKDTIVSLQQHLIDNSRHILIGEVLNTRYCTWNDYCYYQKTLEAAIVAVDTVLNPTASQTEAVIRVTNDVPDEINIQTLQRYVDDQWKSTQDNSELPFFYVTSRLQQNGVQPPDGRLSQDGKPSQYRSNLLTAHQALASYCAISTTKKDIMKQSIDTLLKDEALLMQCRYQMLRTAILYIPSCIENEFQELNQQRKLLFELTDGEKAEFDIPLSDALTYDITIYQKQWKRCMQRKQSTEPFCINLHGSSPDGNNMKIMILPFSRPHGPQLWSLYISIENLNCEILYCGIRCPFDLINFDSAAEFSVEHALFILRVLVACSHIPGLLTNEIIAIEIMLSRPPVRAMKDGAPGAYDDPCLIDCLSPCSVPSDGSLPKTEEEITKKGGFQQSDADGIDDSCGDNCIKECDGSTVPVVDESPFSDLNYFLPTKEQMNMFVPYLIAHGIILSVQIPLRDVRGGEDFNKTLLMQLHEEKLFPLMWPLNSYKVGNSDDMLPLLCDGGRGGNRSYPHSHTALLFSPTVEETSFVEITSPSLWRLPPGAWCGARKGYSGCRTVHYNCGPHTIDWWVVPKEDISTLRIWIMMEFNRDILQEHFLNSCCHDHANFNFDCSSYTCGSHFIPLKWIKQAGVTVYHGLQLPGQVFTIKGDSLFWWKTRGFSDCITSSIANVSEPGQVTTLYENYYQEKMLFRAEQVVRKVPVISLLYLASKYALRRLTAMMNNYDEQIRRSRKRSAILNSGEYECNHFDMKVLGEVEPIRKQDGSNKDNGGIVKSIFSALYPLLHQEMELLKNMGVTSNNCNLDAIEGKNHPLWCSNPRCHAEIFFAYEYLTKLCIKCSLANHYDGSREFGKQSVVLPWSTTTESTTSKGTIGNDMNNLSRVKHDDGLIPSTKLTTEDVVLLEKFCVDRKLFVFDPPQCRSAKKDQQSFIFKMTTKEVAAHLMKFEGIMKLIYSAKEVNQIKQHAEYERKKLLIHFS